MPVRRAIKGVLHGFLGTLSEIEQALATAQERYDAAIKALAPKHKGGEWAEYHLASGDVLRLERALAQAKGEQYADAFDFPVCWDAGAPMPHVLANDHRTFLIFYLRDVDPSCDSTSVKIIEPADTRAQPLALIEFNRCASFRMGDPNDEVFHGHPLSGRGLEGYRAQIVRNSEWIKELENINKVHTGWFLAQPTDGEEHYNPRTGRPSRRSEESVSAWRFLVIESDQAQARHWIAALVQLPLRIAAIYTSGGRSIHALVRVDAPSKAAWDEEKDSLKPALIVLGADPRALSAIRLTRLPACYRGDRLQRLLYLNPEPQAVPICECPPLRDGPATWLRLHEKYRTTEEGLNAPDAPGGILSALSYYACEHRACAAAVAYWRDLA